MTEKSKRYEKEWSFSFEEIGNRINEAFGSLTEEPKTAEFSEPLNAATAAAVTIAPGVAQLNVAALPEGDSNLFHAHAVYLGEIDFTAQGESERTVEMIARRHEEFLRNFKISSGRQAPKWTVGISRSVPVNLNVDMGVGGTTLDLGALTLTALDLEGGVGGATVTLPRTEPGFKMKLEGGVGANTLRIPVGSHLDCNIKGGIGGTTLHVSADTALSLTVDGGVGGTTLHVAPGTALRIEAEGGVGGVSVPKTLRQLEGSDDFVSKSGIWETPGFALAGKQVVVRFKGGVGGLTVRQPDVQVV